MNWIKKLTSKTVQFEHRNNFNIPSMFTSTMFSTSSFFNTKLSSGPQIWFAELCFESNSTKTFNYLYHWSLVCVCVFHTDCLWLSIVNFTVNILHSTALFFHSSYQTVSPLRRLRYGKTPILLWYWRLICSCLCTCTNQWRFSEWPAQSAISLESSPSAMRPSLHWLCDEAEASKQERRKTLTCSSPLKSLPLRPSGFLYKSK